MKNLWEELKDTWRAYPGVVIALIILGALIVAVIG
jgi:hypothetical protein